MIKQKIAIIVLLTPLLVWSFFKSVRIVASELNGLICTENNLCIDEIERLDLAKSLFQESLAFTNENIGVLNFHPKVVFCSTQSCADSFGLTSTAVHFPPGIVLGPRAWKRHYIVHELIHRWQQEQFGLGYAYSKPQWYIEGMAYSLSNDPRVQLAEPFQQYRQIFQKWLAEVGKDNLLEAGKEL